MLWLFLLFVYLGLLMLMKTFPCQKRFRGAGLTPRGFLRILFVRQSVWRLDM